jgi:hypothetical protein
MKINENFLGFSLTIPPEINDLRAIRSQRKNLPEPKSIREHEADDKNKESMMGPIVIPRNPVATR